ncbi:MAG: PDR/VanB family oxidoreductase [Rhodococcus sp. (in: high G+C Gram-positive bacteria)]|nr:PDR/VanB family oxidoreductase [Rhodococcus sp. (in: high G+C Gram-positive bacteria)]
MTTTESIRIQRAAAPSRIMRVSDKRFLAEGVVNLRLEDVTGSDLPPWSPGAHIDIELEPGLVRQYSLCGAQQDRSGWTIAVLLDAGGRGGSRYVHEHLDEGQQLTVTGPRNNFELQPAQSYVFVAGGIGITPLLPMIEQAETERANWTLVYCGRSRTSMAFLDIAEKYPDKVHIHVDDESGIFDFPDFLGSPRDSTLVYACGPNGLLGVVEGCCADWPSESFHCERFSPVQFDGVVDSEFIVSLDRSGRDVVVRQSQSIIDALDEAGIRTLSSCGEGTCGTCETGIISGRADHRDSILDASERESNTTMMICVSRASGDRIVLDL